MTKNHGSAVPESESADDTIVVRLLNGALATEIVCVLRYQRHHVMATRMQAPAVAREFLMYANEEQRHANLIAARIRQLGGALIFSPDGLLTGDHPTPGERTDLVEMVHEDLVAERLCIESYGELIRHFGNGDPASRQLFEEILAAEEQHAGDLNALIDVLWCEKREAFFAPHAGQDGVALPLGADQPRRVDAWIDYFGNDDASRTLGASDACGEALLDGDGAR